MAFDHEFRGSPPAEANVKGCSGDGRDLPGEFFECDACTEMRPVEGSETVTVFTHRIEGRAVSRDLETICAACLSNSGPDPEPDYDDYPPEYDHRYYEEK